MMFLVHMGYISFNNGGGGGIFWDVVDDLMFLVHMGYIKHNKKHKRD